jgi:hypothetical protein
MRRMSLFAIVALALNSVPGAALLAADAATPAGSFYTQPSTYPHVTKCLAGSECVSYVEGDAAWDLKPVAAPK